ncbi:hypothetical protein Fleli_2627 [Bernardetia litoralis DSM 6794]|uniref:Uncharacterized protein n=1 Tax=Bernardetia litoralis (strain ATCC 23117 / DSM 6794 / NBRC 15988 / NCIMB 1366 / Fx l1 / Sio-4) TaxID=880071 RepID=I4AM04_BERLS|nr:hypothetical protein Fleli_2627 [Bernardetia litoralis DSM 6794]
MFSVSKFCDIIDLTPLKKIRLLRKIKKLTLLKNKIISIKSFKTNYN